MAGETSYYPYQQNHPQAYGYLGAIGKPCNKGDVCKYYTSYFYKPCEGFIWKGNEVKIWRDGYAIIQGAVWFSKPTLNVSTGTYTEPAYLSEEKLDISSIPQTVNIASNQSQEIKNKLKEQTFTFKTTKGAPGTTLYIGYITDKNHKGWMGYQYEVNSNFEWLPPRSNKNGLWLKFDTGSIAPGINKASILITNWSPIVNRSKEAFITWNKVTNQASTVVANANGTNTGTYGPTPQDANAGDASNTNRKKPADVSISDGSSFVYKATRSNSLPSSASDQVTLYTYTHPTLGNFKYTSPAFTVQNNIINANHNLALSWQSNQPKNHNKSTQPTNKGANPKSTSDQHKTQLKMKNTVTTDVSTTATNSPATSVTIPWQNIMKYVPFDSTKTTGETVTLTLTKTHAQDGDITKAELTKQITVRYIPTEAPSWPAAPQTGFNLNSATGTILQTNSVVDKDPNNSIWVSFTYPAGEYGIIDGYRVRVKSQDGTWFGPYWYNTDRSNPKLNPSVRIPTQDIKFGMQNEVYIEAFYKHDDGQRYYGPTLKKGFPSVITKMTTPTIIYPTNASEWINKNYRILFSLPHDGDWGDYTDSIKNGYTYRDIQIRINNTVTYSWKNNPEIFSINPLKPHEAKIVINPSLMSTYPNATSYTFQVRVRKNYGYLDSQEEASWSLWSAARVVTVKPASFSVNKGDYIMASHYNLLKPLMVRMRNTYPTYDVTTTTVQVGDYIMADGFISPYRDILQCFNTVNGWGTYNSARNSVKFNKGINIPLFEPQVGEYVTAMRQDKIYNLSPGAYDGRNYIGIMFDDANLCK